MLVAALRQRILDLAIRGKLVPQRPEDGTAEELYRQIQREKKKLIAAGKHKKEKPLTPISEDEIPFDIPDSWKWVRLGELGVFERGAGIKKSEVVKEGLPCVRYGQLYTTYKESFAVAVSFVAEELFAKCKQAHTGDILMALTGENKPDIALAVVYEGEKPLAIGGDMTRFTPIHVNSHYLMRVINSPLGIAQKVKTATGDIIVHSSNDKLASVLIPLPSLAEQQRIVEKVGALFAELESIERSQEKVAAIQGELNKRILERAIQGKLVPQRPEDGTAEELYQQIQKEKKKLIAAGKLKKEKPLPPITEEEIPFDIPESWKWVRLGDCTTYGQPKQKATPDQVEDDTWCLELEDIEKDTGRILQRLTVAERPIKGDRAVFNEGNVLFSKLRPYLHKILVAVADGVCTTELVPFSCYGGIIPEYIALVLKSPWIDQRICGTAYGVKMPRVGTEDMLMLPVPIPPKSEQLRICLKIKKYAKYGI